MAEERTDEQVATQIQELLYQALETEKGGVEVYKTALRCALNEDLKEEWGKIPRGNTKSRSSRF
jgi:rubrerythrin